MPTKLNVEIRCRRNADGTFDAAAYQDGSRVVNFDVRRATCDQVAALYVRLAAEYPDDVAVRVAAPCSGCISGTRWSEIVEAARRARSVIGSSWETVAASYTMGWGLPIAAVSANYPFISDAVWSLRRTLSRELPALIYLSRESPPARAVVALPYSDPESSADHCRLVSVGELSADEAALLSGFSLAIWFLMGTGVLPLPQQGDALMRALLGWTGPALVDLG